MARRLKLSRDSVKHEKISVNIIATFGNKKDAVKYVLCIYIIFFPGESVFNGRKSPENSGIS